ncbi:hypothetical protein [Demequina mangrovi]|uniref:SPW repeat-containing protein n=1 Tax=Demequina mangrovi TaxID=1043493 RepID=A0A1H7AI20_9MICO|nr:hypothetical protein [Demequina mangrovi]SEJ61570.1 hypothetical protein SAMN05421637_2411 [Demequina mangrovi]
MIASLARSSMVLAVLSMVALAGTSAWFAAEAWTGLEAGERLLVGACLAVGLACSAAAVVLVREERWAWAAGAALVATVTPTGDVYLGNAMTLALAICTGGIVLLGRSRRLAPAAR